MKKKIKHRQIWRSESQTMTGLKRKVNRPRDPQRITKKFKNF